jgi:hypothetical protein
VLLSLSGYLLVLAGLGLRSDGRGSVGSRRRGGVVGTGERRRVLEGVARSDLSVLVVEALFVRKVSNENDAGRRIITIFRSAS